jgi:hypothetical protein
MQGQIRVGADFKDYCTDCYATVDFLYRIFGGV